MNDHETITTYPNREHENADKAAKRRAIRALDDISNEVGILRRKLDQDVYVDGDDTQILVDRFRQLTIQMTILGTLSDVRDWHEADLAEPVTVKEA